MNQFYGELAFTVAAGRLTIAAPENSNQVSPCYYMLFITASTGVPSVARIVRVGSASTPLPPPSPPPPSSSSTVGLTTIGSDLDSGESNFLNGSMVTTSGGGPIVSMSVY